MTRTVKRAARAAIGLAAFAVVTLTAFAAPAGSQPLDAGEPVLSLAAAKYYGYATPVVFVQKASAVSYYNFDIEKHNVVHDAVGDGVYSKKKQPWCRDFQKGKCPVFWSKLIGGLENTPVKGLESIEPGMVYSFYCTLHPGMRGRLVALP